MGIEGLHYDFKRKLNKVDSQRNRNFLIPEIDLYLNEGLLLLVKLIARPRQFRGLGFEINSRTTNDIRTIVVTAKELSLEPGNIVKLPTDYAYDIKHQALISRSNCGPFKTRKVDVFQHEDDYENNPFFKSNFEWRELVVVMNKKGIECIVEDFTVNKYILSYIQKHPYMHYAEGYGSGTYKTPAGEFLTGKQDCLLPEEAHIDVVNLAVYLASGDINSPDLQIKLNNLSLNQII